MKDFLSGASADSPQYTLPLTTSGHENEINNRLSSAALN
jgi:hypothetical protein